MPFLVLHVVCSFLRDLVHVLTRSDRDQALELVLLRQQARQISWHLQDGEPGAVRPPIRDRDGKFAAGFDTVFASQGIEVIETLVRAPNANAVAERVVRSIREECLDHLLILNQRHLAFVLRQFVAYYNYRRPHKGLGQSLPVPLALAPTSPATPERVQCRPVLGGIIHDYAIAA
jgi:transposase InsO family protein